MQGKSFHITASNKVITKETHRQETEAAKKTPVTQQGPQTRALHQGSAVKSGTDSKFAGPTNLSWRSPREADETTEKYTDKKSSYQEEFPPRNVFLQGPTPADTEGKNQGTRIRNVLEGEKRETRRREGPQEEEISKKLTTVETENIAL